MELQYKYKKSFIVELSKCETCGVWYNKNVDKHECTTHKNEVKT